MARRWTFFLTTLALLGGVAWWLGRRRVTISISPGTAAPSDPAPPAPPAAPAPAAPAPAAAPRWLPPVDGGCPDGYQVKVNETSGIFHLPGGRFYDRTIPQRCYASADDAEVDGYRRAKA